MSIVDLSVLPAPQVLEDLDFEQVFQDDLAAFRLHMGDNWDALLESDPVTKLLEVGAYRKLGNRARGERCGEGAAAGLRQGGRP